MNACINAAPACVAPAAMPLCLDVAGDLDLVALIAATSDAPLGAYHDCRTFFGAPHAPTGVTLPRRDVNRC